MNIKIDEEIIQKAIYCKSDFSCLSGEKRCLCEVKELFGYAVDCTTRRTVDMRKCLSKSHETFNNLKANFRQEAENQTDFYQRQKTGGVVQKKSRTEYLSKAFKAHITRKQKAIKIFYDLFDPMDFRNKDSSHEHHDLIVGKGDLELI